MHKFASVLPVKEPCTFKYAYLCAHVNEPIYHGTFCQR